MEKSTDKYGRGKKDESDSDKDDEESEWFLEMVNQLKLKEKKRPNLVYPLPVTKLNMDGICEYIKAGHAKRIITMSGAGISTSAGIPDFRSSEDGLYARLEKDPRFNLPKDNPLAIFDIAYFQHDPRPFYMVAKDLFPDPTKYKPTIGHHFIRLLQDKKMLLRHYTQNVDGLERAAGVKDENLVEAHGSYHKSHCLTCKTEHSIDDIKDTVLDGKVPKCKAMSKEDPSVQCLGVVKPDIVFFGEELDENYFNKSMADFPKCDLLIVMGTSLVVQPFSSLPDRVEENVLRIYINREKSDGGDDPVATLLCMDHGFYFEGDPKQKRDVFLQGNCDDMCQQMAEKIGWADDLKALRDNYGKAASHL